jgi:uncharacterized protein YjbI with pentapeptide repeats
MADLREADLSNADLSQANLQDASLTGTIFRGTNLQTTKNISLELLGKTKTLRNAQLNQIAQATIEANFPELLK